MGPRSPDPSHNQLVPSLYSALYDPRTSNGVYRQLYDCQNCRRAHSSASSTPAPSMGELYLVKTTSVSCTARVLASQAEAIVVL